MWDDREAWFFINPMSRTVEESISKDGFSEAIDLLGNNFVEQSGDAMRVRVAGINLACFLLSP